MKVVLRVITVAAVILFVVFQVVVWRRGHPPVRIKSGPELARLPVSTDSYPCLFVERATPLGPLRADLRQCTPALNNDVDIEQYEVDLRSGFFRLRKTDLFVSDRMPLALTRGYRTQDRHSRAFGNGSNHPYDIFPYGDQFPYTYMGLLLGDDTDVHYSRISEGTSYLDFVAEHNGTPGLAFQKSQVRWDVDHWELTFQDGTVFRFPEAYRAKRGVDGALTGMRSAQGDEIEFVRDGKHNLIRLMSPSHHEIRLAYDDHDRVSDASDDVGRTMHYSYGQNGNLTEVRENGHLRWQYSYDAYGMTAVQDGEKRIVAANGYSLARISRMTLDRLGTYYFNYLVTRAGKIESVMVTEPSGKQVIVKL